MCVGIICFLVGDIMLIDHLNKASFIIGKDGIQEICKPVEEFVEEN